MKKIVSLFLIMMFTLLLPIATFADIGEKYTDIQLYNLASDGIFINTDTISVRRALPNDVVIPAEYQDEFIADFIVITEKLGNDIILQRVTGKIEARDSVGGAVYLTVWIEYKDYSYDGATYRNPIKYGSYTSGIYDGAQVTKVESKYSDYGNYCIFDSAGNV